MMFLIPSMRCNGALVLAVSAISSALLLGTPGSLVDAHGYLTSPLAEFKDGAMPTKYAVTMSPAFQGKFDDSPQANVDTFTKAFKEQKQFATLKDLLKDHGGDCGDSKPDASAKAIPADGKVVWQNVDTGEGFVASHMGPCEIWLDDKRVFSDENCAGHFTSKPKAELPVDFSSCKENCMLRFYWLALHEPAWQVYKNCVPLSGNGGSKGSGANNVKSLNFASTNEYGSPSVANEYDSPSTTPAAAPSPSSSPSQSSESSPATTNEYGTASATPSVSPSPSSSAAYSTPEATQQGHKNCKTESHARKLRK